MTTTKASRRPGRPRRRVTLAQINDARRNLATLGRRIDRETNPHVRVHLEAMERTAAYDLDVLTDAWYGGGAHELD